MPRLHATVFACLALAAGAIAGCGDSNKDTSSTPAAPPPAATTAANPPPAASAAGDVVKVTMKNIKFVPESITAKVGQKIEWTNTDAPAHTVTATSGAKFDSGNLAPGASFSYTPTKAGTIDYVCTIHSGQTGTITVTK
jgi:plastocyanin